MKLIYREAEKGELHKLVSLLADDDLGTSREDPSSPLNQSYGDAFDSISRDPNNELIVVESTGNIVGMLQLTFIPSLTHTGSWRCLIEGVRVASSQRGKSLGSQLIEWAIRRAKEKHCRLVQLTSDKQRPDAIRFYESLGFKATHEGLKLKL